MHRGAELHVRRLVGEARAARQVLVIVVRPAETRRSALEAMLLFERAESALNAMEASSAVHQELRASR